MAYQSDMIHPKHPHNLECPHCKKHTVVLRGEDRYVCLSCGWWEDLNDGQGWGENGAQMLLLMASTGFFVFVLMLNISDDVDAERERNISLLWQRPKVTAVALDRSSLL
ncbi:MAG: hypothetical protein ACPGVO_14945 [Spirulinaceae cyanobacterium]